MGFELIVAARRDPLDAAHANDAAMVPASTTVLLNGFLDDDAVRALLRTLEQLVERGDDSIVVDMQSIEGIGAGSLTLMTNGLMTLRTSGHHVQLCVRESALHAKMAAMPDARDWLLAQTEGDVGGARRAIHLDGPSEHG